MIADILDPLKHIPYEPILCARTAFYNVFSTFFLAMEQG